MTCRQCRQAIPAQASTFVVPATHEHSELTFCSLDCVDQYITERQAVAS